MLIYLKCVRIIKDKKYIRRNKEFKVTVEQVHRIPNSGYPKLVK
jgi:hypothetical protein